MSSEDITDYAQPVHQSLMEKKMLFGIGDKAFYAIALVTLILCSLISFYCIGIGVLALLICKKLCKKEPMFMEFLFENLSQQDRYEG